MDKEIEKALKELEEELKWTHNDGVNLTKYDEERFNVIKQALLELKSIKEADPSEALRKLDIIRHLEIGFDKNGNAITLNDTSALKIIEQALTTKSEKEKAFDVIKKYAVNDGWSNGWVVKFWDMNEEELELVNEVLK
jgi:hypothetical protein